MLNKWIRSGAVIALAGTAMIAASSLAPVAAAQRGDDWDWQGNYQRLNRLNAGTYITVRTTQNISSDRNDGRVWAGVVAEDVWDDYRRLAVPAIPRGSRVEMIVRTARDGDLILDLESVFAHGQRYALSAAPERVESDGRRRNGDDAAQFIGGGAIIGSVIGAIAGGGKGAAIGAATGAAAGAGLAFQGRSVRVPAGSLLTFRLERGLDMGIIDNGFTRDRGHYHQNSGPEYPDRNPDRRR